MNCGPHSTPLPPGVDPDTFGTAVDGDEEAAIPADCGVYARSLATIFARVHAHGTEAGAGAEVST
jgi:hypothetical protein